MISEPFNIPIFSFLGMESNMNDSLNDDIIEISIEHNTNKNQRKKRKSIEEISSYHPSPSKVQKINRSVDPLCESIQVLSKQLISNSEMIKKNLFDDRCEYLNKWVENSETEIEIRIESLKVQLDMVEQALIKKVDLFEKSFFNQDFVNVKSKNPFSKIQKLQKICKFLNKPSEKYFNLKISKEIFKKQNVGAIFKYIPKYLGCLQAVYYNHFEDFEYHLNKENLDSLLRNILIFGFF